MVSTGTTPPEEAIFRIFTKTGIRGSSYPWWTFRWLGRAPPHAGTTRTLGRARPAHLNARTEPPSPAGRPRSLFTEQAFAAREPRGELTRMTA